MDASCLDRNGCELKGCTHSKLTKISQNGHSRFWSTVNTFQIKGARRETRGTIVSNEYN